MINFLDYVEDYLKEEGLSKIIPHYRKRSLFQSPPAIVAAIWFGGLWIITVLLTRGFGSLLYTFAFCIISFLIFLFLITLVAVLEQRIKHTSSILNASTLGGILIFGYPVVIIGFIYFRTLEWQSALIALVLVLTLVAILVIVNSTHILILSIHTVQTLLRVIGKSLTALLIIAPVSLVVIILSVFSQDIWLILGNVPWNRYWFVILLLIIPTMFLSYLRVNDESKKLVGEFPRLPDIPKRLEKIDFFSRKFAAGFIGLEEWQITQTNLLWRDQKKIHQSYTEWIENAVKLRLVIYSEAVTIFLAFLFFIYFFLLFNILLSPETISEWTNTEFRFQEYTFGFLTSGISLPTAIESITKVSLLLATIVAIITRISLMSDDDFKGKTLSWLSEKSQDWMSVETIYNCLLYPNHQFWSFKVNKPSIVNSHIIVPPNLGPDRIKAACYQQASSVNKRANLLIVTAFEKEENRENYEFGRPGNRWQLLINKINNIEGFSDISLSSEEELRYNHNKGFECLKSGDQIPSS